MNTDNKGAITAELPQGTYEAKVERYGFNQTCDLTQNVEVLIVEPKKALVEMTDLPAAL